MDLNKPKQVGKHYHFKVNDTYATYWMEGNIFHLAHYTHNHLSVKVPFLPNDCDNYYIHASYWENKFISKNNYIFL